MARGLPYLVAERGGRVVGYCYAGPFRPRSAYRFTLEDSIYIDAGRNRARHRPGPAGAACSIAAPNSAIGRWSRSSAAARPWPSIRLHEALGFARIGVLPAVGFKFGRWVDIVLDAARARAGRDDAAAVTDRSSQEKQWLKDLPIPAKINGYHAHIYYDAGDPAGSRAAARGRSASEFRGTARQLA